MNLTEQYKSCWKYIKESRDHVLAIISVFLLFFILGFVFPIPLAIKEAIEKMIREMIDNTEGLGLRQLIFFIFQNNLKSSFMALFLGAVLGVFPVFSSVINGYVLGFVGKKSVEIAGPSVLLRLLPHGVFELPAVFLSMALGVRLGMFIFSKNKKEEFLKRLTESARVFLFIVLPLLIIAAIIEGILISVLG